MQTVFGGTARSYAIQPTLRLFGISVNVAKVKFFDLYVGGQGVLLQATDPINDAVLFTASYSWLVVVAVLLTRLIAGYAAYRWRLGDRSRSPT